MTERFTTPQDAEDAFYDAIDEQDIAALMAVWEDSEDIACLLPMLPMVHGAAVRNAWEPLLDGTRPVEVEVRHLRWLEVGDLALHYVEERVTPKGEAPQSHPMYATNLYRRGADGWRLILHQNSPAAPPPGALPPNFAPQSSPV